MRDNDEQMKFHMKGVFADPAADDIMCRTNSSYNLRSALADRRPFESISDSMHRHAMQFGPQIQIGPKLMM
jgi:hypothetical protein